MIVSNSLFANITQGHPCVLPIVAMQDETIVLLMWALVATVIACLLALGMRRKKQQIADKSETNYHLEALIQTTSEAIVCADTNGIITIFNHGAEKLFGCSSKKALGSSIRRFTPEEFWEDQELIREQVLSGGNDVRFETIRMDANGQRFPVEISVSISQNNEGQPLSTNAILRDISERKHAEQTYNRQRDTLLELTLSSAFLNGNIDDAIKQLTEACAHALEVSRVSVWFIEQEGTLAVCRDLYNRDTNTHESEQIVVSEDYPSYFNEIRNSLAVDAHDARTDPRTCELKESYLEPNGIRSMLDAAVRFKGDLAGIICFEHTATMRRWRLEEVSFACQVADRVAYALGSEENRRGAEAVRESEQKYRALYTNAPLPYQVLDKEGRIVDVNPAWLAILGYNRNDVVGKYFNDFLEPGQRDEYQEMLADSNQCATRGAEYKVRHVDGTYRDLLSEGCIRYRHDDCESRLQSYCVFTDITEQKRAKAALHQAQEHFHQVVASAQDGVIIYDQELKYVAWNPCMERLTGLTIEDVRGRSPLDVWPQLREYGVGELLAKALKGETVRTPDFPMPFPHNEGERWFAATYMPRRNTSGDIVGVFAIIHDISERNKAEKQLAYSNMIYRLRSSIAKAFVLGKSENVFDEVLDKILTAINASHGFFGYFDMQGNLVCPALSQDSVGGHTSMDDVIILPESSLSGIWAQSLNQKQGILSNKNTHFPGVETSLSSCIVVPVIFQDRAIGQIAAGNKVGGFKDEDLKLLTEVSDYIAPLLYARMRDDRHEQQILDAKEEAEAANRAKSEFLSVMSHEMRTPLNPIMGFCSIMMENANETERDYLETMMRCCKRQLSLIENILAYSRLDKSSVEPKWTNFDLTLLCNDLVERLQLREKPLEIAFINGFDNYRPLPEECLVFGEETMLTSVLDNLLDNAWKYTSSGRIILFAGVGQNDDDVHQFHFAVEDTGVGIPAAKLDNIFEPFTQVDSSFSRDYEGAGLGLAICRKLVDFLGGTIGIQSEVGKGSRFSFDAPMKLLQAADGTESIVHPKALEFSRPMDVLLVEDRSDNAYITQIILNKMGASPTVASSGKQAIECCSQQRYDAILMDLRMPEMDGFETTAAIRAKDGPNSGTPIIAVTANVSSATQERCLSSGMSGFVKKPLTAAELFQALEAVSHTTEEIPQSR